MKQYEYIQLVKSSGAFKSFGIEKQNEILNAEGKIKKQYEQIFLDEKNGILEAKKVMLGKYSDDTKQIEVLSKKAKSGFLENSEGSERAEESAQADDLLKSI